MKPRFKLEERKERRAYNRELAVDYFRQLRAIREASGIFLKTTKNSEFMHGPLSDYIITKIKDLKHKYGEELNLHAPQFAVVRIGRLHENVSEFYPMGMNLPYRRMIVQRLKNRVKDIRSNQRHNNDPLANRAVNSILRRYQTTILDKTKKPSDQSEYVGIEIECIVPSGANMGALLPFSKWVNVGSDGSIQHEGDEEGKEIRVCVKREEIRAVVPGIMQALQSMGARVNKSCGLHVHLDQRANLEPEKTFQKLVRSLGLLYTVVPKSRRENTYCKRNRRTAFASNDRYKAINSLAYRRYKTLEIRLFGGTLNAEKVMNWIETLEAIAHGEMVNRCPKNFDTARKYWTGLSDANVAWLKARQIEFSPALVTAPQSESDSGADMRTADGLQFARQEEDTSDDESNECADCEEHRDDCNC